MILKKNLLKVSFAYWSLLTLILNANSLFVFTVIQLLVVPNTYAEESNSQLLDSLKNKYHLANPNRNHRGSDGISDTMVEQINSPSLDMTEAMNRVLSKPRNSEVIDFGKYGQQSPQQLLQQYAPLGTKLSKTHGQPEQDASGRTKLSYAKQGTRRYFRDANGKLKFEVIENVERVESGLKEEDLFSSELRNSDYDFKANDLYGDQQGLILDGRRNYEELKTGETGSARGFQAITQSIDRGINTNISSTDPTIQLSYNEILQAESNSGDFYQSCITTTETHTQELEYPIYEEHYCQDTRADNLFYCEVERIYNISHLVSNVSGAVKVSVCGEGCIDIEMGEKENNALRGSCTLYTESATVALNPKFQVDKVTMVESVVDDHSLLSINSTSVWSMIRGQYGVGGSLPTSGCDGGKSHKNTSHQGNIESEVKRQHQTNNGTLEFDWRTVVGDKGEGYIKIRVNLSDPSGVGFGVQFQQSPEGCYDAIDPEYRARNSLAGMEADSGSGGGIQYYCRYESPDDTVPEDCYGEGAELGFNSDSCSRLSNDIWGCSVPPASTSTQNSPAPYSFCRFDTYSPIEVGERGIPQPYLDLLPPFYEGDEGYKTWKVNLDGYRCDPMGGQEWCVASRETGEPECYTWDDMLEKPDHCAQYKDDTACSEIERECTEGWYDEQHDVCFADTVTYRCDRGSTISYEYEDTNNVCTGALPCIGGDCEFGPGEENKRFLEAMTTASVLQNMKSDRSCTDNTDPDTCRVFEGERKYCSWETSGLGMDCCEAPGGLNILSYVAFSNQMLKLDAMIADGSFGQATQGAYNTLREPIVNVWNSYIAEPLASAAESMVGNLSGSVAATGSEVATEFALDVVLDEIKQQMMQFVYDMLPDQLANMIFTTGASGAGSIALSEGMNQALNFVGNVMAVYAAYQMIKLALTLLTACEEEEMDMGMKIAQRVCFKEGDKYCNQEVLGICYQKRQDYCCYSSILARSVMEQAAPMLDKDMSLCEGLTQSELGQLDWDRIDLSEWIALLIDAGEIPTTASEQSLTGGGRVVEGGCDVYETTNPDTGEVTTESSCYGKNEGGRIENAYSRQVTSERNKERMEGAAQHAAEVRVKARQALDQLDCSVTPRPQLCEYGFDVREGGN